MTDAAMGEDRDLPDGMWGFYDPDTHTITLARGLSPAEQRCTLVHEQIHAERGDTCAEGTPADAWYDEKRERAVEREAARRLIDIHELARLALLHGDDLEAIADDLVVDLDTLVTRMNALHPAERHYLRRRLEAKEHVA